MVVFHVVARRAVHRAPLHVQEPPAAIGIHADRRGERDQRVVGVDYFYVVAPVQYPCGRPVGPDAVRGLGGQAVVVLCRVPAAVGQLVGVRLAVYGIHGPYRYAVRPQGLAVGVVRVQSYVLAALACAGDGVGVDLVVRIVLDVHGDAVGPDAPRPVVVRVEHEVLA